MFSGYMTLTLKGNLNNIRSMTVNGINCNFRRFVPVLPGDEILLYHRRGRIWQSVKDESSPIIGKDFACGFIVPERIGDVEPNAQLRIDEIKSFGKKSPKLEGEKLLIDKAYGWANSIYPMDGKQFKSYVKPEISFSIITQSIPKPGKNELSTMQHEEFETRQDFYEMVDHGTIDMRAKVISIDLGNGHVLDDIDIKNLGIENVADMHRWFVGKYENTNIRDMEEIEEIEYTN